MDLLIIVCKRFYVETSAATIKMIKVEARKIYWNKRHTISVEISSTISSHKFIMWTNIIRKIYSYSHSHHLMDK